MIVTRSDIISAVSCAKGFFVACREFDEVISLGDDVVG